MHLINSRIDFRADANVFSRYDISLGMHAYYQKLEKIVKLGFPLSPAAVELCRS
jgi:hypothetical protein